MQVCLYLGGTMAPTTLSDLPWQIYHNWQVLWDHGFNVCVVALVILIKEQGTKCWYQKPTGCLLLPKLYWQIMSEWELVGLRYTVSFFRAKDIECIGQTVIPESTGCWLFSFLARYPLSITGISAGYSGSQETSADAPGGMMVENVCSPQYWTWEASTAWWSFGPASHVALWMALSVVWFRQKYLNDFWMDFHGLLHRWSWSMESESYWLPLAPPTGQV